MNSRQTCHGYINLAESFITNEALSGFDVIVVCRNWEERSVSALKRVDNKPIIVELIFSDRPAPQYIDIDVDNIIEEARSEGRLREILLETAVDVRANCALIHRDLSVEFKSDRRVIIDVTSIPKVYTISIVGWCFSERCIPMLWFIYQEGEYRSAALDVAGADEIKLANFTRGPWTLIQVPYLEGDMSIEDGDRLVAFCRGDHERILSALSDYEHLDRSAIITSTRPNSPDQIAKDHADSLVENAGLDLDNIHFADPMSAIDALVCAKEILRQRPEGSGYGGIVLPFSTKPHALAAAVIGVFGPGVTILARQPMEYVAQDIAPAERAILISMADLSSPFVADML